MAKRKTLLTGIQPTGRLHLGNYFGMMAPTLALTNEYDAYISIVDFHALTTVRDGKELASNTLNIAMDFLAVGLDPNQATLFVQSDVPEVAELAWIFNCLVTVPFLERAHAYKDKTAKGIEPTMGLFDYPVLQAADILIQQADVVPVGEDQRQHVEYARDIAEKFNHAYGDTFTIPKHVIQDAIAIVPGTDGQKMSKSYNNTIPLFGSDEEIRKAVMGIPTDSKKPEEPKDPEKDIIFQFHKLVSGDNLESIRKGYSDGGLSYADSKNELVENMIAFIKPLREKRMEVEKNRGDVLKILENGAQRAREQALLMMRDVREKVGIHYS